MIWCRWKCIWDETLNAFLVISAAEAVKVLKILCSSKAPLVKKRQAMRNTFGDYRAKMRKEQTKSAAGGSSVVCYSVTILWQSSTVYIRRIRAMRKSNLAQTRGWLGCKISTQSIRRRQLIRNYVNTLCWIFQEIYVLGICYHLSQF